MWGYILLLYLFFSLQGGPLVRRIASTLTFLTSFFTLILTALVLSDYNSAGYYCDVPLSKYVAWGIALNVITILNFWGFEVRRDDNRFEGPSTGLIAWIIVFNLLSFAWAIAGTVYLAQTETCQDTAPVMFWATMFFTVIFYLLTGAFVTIATLKFCKKPKKERRHQRMRDEHEEEIHEEAPFVRHDR
eukprot:GILI01006398.1.p1 GENE.GILI01006398.1~~GILI01006398.1.p1  ORF type:complete len:188 (-),score=28.96 GILI01006398.1:51-614(-)